MAGYQQGKLIDKQTTALVHMDGSTASTATAMTAASTSLKTLAEDQEKSIDRLNQMNDILRESLGRTSTMASASRKQLQILEQEQANRLAEQSKKQIFSSLSERCHSRLSLSTPSTRPRIPSAI